MRLNITVVMPDGQPKLIDGLPFTLSDMPREYEATLAPSDRPHYGYCTTIGVAVGKAFWHEDLAVLWGADVPVVYATSCLAAGRSIDETVQAWEADVPVEFASA